MMQNITFRKKLVIGFMIFIVVVATWSIKYALDNMLFQDHGRIRLLNIPSKITMEINNRKYVFSDSDVYIPITPGTYTLLFSSEGFEDKKIEGVSVVKDADTPVSIELEPASEEARQELEKNYEKYDLIRQLSFGENFNIKKKEFDSRFPILSHLPFYERGYAVLSCSPYRKGTIENGGLGVCINIDEPDMGDITLVNNAIQKTLALIDDDDEKYDISINGAIYPRKSELDEGIVYDCSREDIAFCYLYKDSGSDSIIPHL